MISKITPFDLDEGKQTVFSKPLSLTLSINLFYQKLGFVTENGEKISNYIRDIKEIVREFEFED